MEYLSVSVDDLRQLEQLIQKALKAKREKTKDRRLSDAANLLAGIVTDAA